MSNLEVIDFMVKSKTPLVSNVTIDEYTEIANECFDFDFKGENVFFPYEIPNRIPKDFGIGLIVGGSGTGKSTLLKNFGIEDDLTWDNTKAIISHFDTPQEAVEKFNAVGLSSVPTWTKPYNVLSTGEKFRATMAKKIKDNAVIDEFTSVVDRDVAKSCSVAVEKYIRSKQIKNVIFCTCHKDIIEWLNPDWIIDTDLGILYDGRGLRRPNIYLNIYETNYKAWEIFKNHHYLTQDINKASKVYIATWGENIVGFASYLPYPSGTLKSAFRGHRFVVLPEYQGLGIGKVLFEFVAKAVFNKSGRFFVRTTHLKVINYMMRSKNWRETSTSGKKRYKGRENRGDMSNWKLDFDRAARSFEYLSNDYVDKESYKVGAVLENDGVKYEKVFEMLSQIHKKCYNENKFMIVYVLVGKNNIGVIDEVCINEGYRRENLKKTTKVDEMIYFS